MSSYTKLKIVLTIVLSIIVSFFTYTYLKSLKNDTTVVIATQDIDSHTIITPEMLEEVEISKEDREVFEENAATTKKDLENAISKVKIKKGKAINKEDDVVSGTKEELIEKKAMLEDGSINNDYFISNNKRITTVALDTEGSVDSKLKAGDYVDVIFTHTGDEQNSFSTTIMQHIEIYDVQSHGSGSTDSTENISLIVTPEQAVDITYAKRNGKVDLILESSNGSSETTHTSSIREILNKSNSKTDVNNSKADTDNSDSESEN